MNTEKPNIEESHAYEMGYNCGENGANTTNCNFVMFSSTANTKAWERGKRDAEALLTYESKKCP